MNLPSADRAVESDEIFLSYFMRASAASLRFGVSRANEPTRRIAGPWPMYLEHTGESSFRDADGDGQRPPHGRCASRLS